MPRKEIVMTVPARSYGVVEKQPIGTGAYTQLSSSMEQIADGAKALDDFFACRMTS